MVSYSVFGYLAWIGVIDYVVVDRFMGTWNDGLRPYLQPAIGHLQDLIVDKERGRRRCSG